MEFGTDQAILRSSRAVSSTVPAFSFRVKFFAQLMQSQKCSIRLADVGNPKKRPPSIRMSNREQRGLAHLEIIQLGREKNAHFGCCKTRFRRPRFPVFFTSCSPAPNCSFQSSIEEIFQTSMGLPPAFNDLRWP